MKEILRWTLRSAWILIAAFFIFWTAVTQDIFDALVFSLMFGLPLWTVQLIIFGIVNPLRFLSIRINKVRSGREVQND